MNTEKKLWEALKAHYGYKPQADCCGNCKHKNLRIVDEDPHLCVRHECGQMPVVSTGICQLHERLDK